MIATALHPTPVAAPGRDRVAAALLVLVGLFTIAGTFVFADWSDGIMVPFSLMTLALGAGLIAGAVALVRGVPGARPALLALVALHLVFDLSNIAFAGEPEVAPVAVLQLVVLALLLGRRG
jgi:hypothetical protein